MENFLIKAININWWRYFQSESFDWEFLFRDIYQGDFYHERFLWWNISIQPGISLQSTASRYSQWHHLTVNDVSLQSIRSFPCRQRRSMCMIATRRRRMSTFIFSHHGMLIMLKSSIPQSGHRLHTWHACTAQLAHSDQQQTRQPELNTHNHHRRWRPESNHYRRTESLHQQRWQEKAVASRWKKRSIKPCVIQ